jgi:Tfp pilus assembly protein PilN
MPAQTPIAMTCDIDFLPASYYEVGLQRKHATLRVVVVVVFLSLVIFAAIYQQFLRSWTNQQLTDLLPQLDLAKQETQHLAELQQSLQTAEKRADLFTYLRHPWPRSQILATLAEPLPDEIVLTEISILREPLPVANLAASQLAAKPGETALAKLDPAERDLLALREWCDRTQIVVKCSGLTDDPVSLHHYLEQLSHDSLLSKVEVGSVERVSADSNGRIRFTARLLVRPGYGQPNGPKPGTETITQLSPSTN